MKVETGESGGKPPSALRKEEITLNETTRQRKGKGIGCGGDESGHTREVYKPRCSRESQGAGRKRKLEAV